MYRPAYRLGEKISDECASVIHLAESMKETVHIRSQWPPIEYRLLSEELDLEWDRRLSHVIEKELREFETMYKNADHDGILERSKALWEIPEGIRASEQCSNGIINQIKAELARVGTRIDAAQRRRLNRE